MSRGTPTDGWNFGDLLEALDEVMPGDAPALIHDDEVRRWPDFAARSNRLAHALVARGARPDDKIARTRARNWSLSGPWRDFARRCRGE